MKPATLRFLALLLTAVGGLALIVTLHFSGRSIDMESSTRVLRLLAELDELDARLNRSLLQASVEAQPDAEQMLEAVIRFEINVTALPDDVPGDIDSPETRESWERMKTTMLEKKLLIQDYIASFAVQRHTARQLLNLGERWIDGEPSRERAIMVSQLLNQVRQVGVTGDQSALEPINQQLAELAQQVPNGNEKHQALTISLLEQALEVLAMDSESNDLLTAAFALPIRESISSHAENYTQVFTQRIEEDKRRDDQLFYLAVLLGGVVVIALVFMRQQTNVLNRTLDELEFQQFAVDQHALVSITDPEGRITYANQLFTDLSGYSAGELMGENHEIFRSGEHPPEFYQELWKTIRAGQVWHGQLKHRGKQGNEYWVESTVVPFIDKQGAPSRHVFIRTDITRNKQLELELAAARELAEAANAAKSAFLANMSHEIRTPMNAIIGMSNLALEGELTARQRGYIEKVLRAAESLLGIINDILDFSKIEAGHLELESINFKLSSVIDNLASLLASRVSEKDLELLFDIHPELPATLVGDPLRLGQVLTNLCTNAVKFTERGEVVVTVRADGMADDGRTRVRFEIRDTGIGMTPEQRSRLFQSFSQADASTTRKYGGTGLGLAISKQLVEAMAGQIGVDSEPGVGSCFHFTALFGVADTGESVADSEAPGSMRVLVADDNDVARELIETMLTRFGFDCELAADGRQAVDRVIESARAEQPFDLVLMDWKMPELDGVEAVRTIREETRRLSLPKPKIVMATAFGRADLLHAQQELAVETILSKPITSSSLYDALVGTYLGRQQQAIEQQKRQSEISTAAEKLRGARVLVVEDNPVNQELALELLSRNGMIASVANNGQEALEVLSHQLFDGVLMDGQMPLMDGYQTTREIRKRPYLAELPVIAMTADVMSGDKERCLQAGMNDFIPKPINMRQMLETMARWISPGSQPQRADGDGATQAEGPVAGDLPHRIEGIDLREALEIVAGDEELLIKMFELFIQTTGDFAERFLQDCASGDLETPARAAHSLKGAASNIGALRLAAGAKDLEWAVKNGGDDVDAKLAAVKTELDSVLTALQPVVRA